MTLNFSMNLIYHETDKNADVGPFPRLKMVVSLLPKFSRDPAKLKLVTTHLQQSQILSKFG